MSDAYLPKPHCPVCDSVIKEGCTKCPSCKVILVTCGRCGSIVQKNKYKTNVEMCENCWDDTINQEK
jgi:hypothetical protein